MNDWHQWVSLCFKRKKWLIQMKPGFWKARIYLWANRPFLLSLILYATISRLWVLPPQRRTSVTDWAYHLQIPVQPLSQGAPALVLWNHKMSPIISKYVMSFSSQINLNLFHEIWFSLGRDEEYKYYEIT